MTKTTALLACAMVLPLAKHVAAEPVIDETQSPSEISPDMAPTPDPGVIDASPGSFSDVTVTNGASSLHVVPNGNTIWDYDALTTNNTSAATLRFFRNTLTTGLVQMMIYNGAGLATIVIDAKGASSFRNAVGFAATNALYHIDVSGVNDRNQTTSNRLLNADTVNATFDTTAGDLQSYGAYFNVHSGKSAGTGVLTNVGIYGNAQSFDTTVQNIAAYFDKGDVMVKAHSIAGGTAPAVTACGTGATISGDDKSGAATEASDATGCQITFAAPYATAPACVVTSAAGQAFTYTVATTGITITNVGTVAGTRVVYHCRGH